VVSASRRFALALARMAGLYTTCCSEVVIMEFLFIIVGSYFLLRALRELAMLSAFWRRDTSADGDE
jgi:hypothetical protein